MTICPWCGMESHDDFCSWCHRSKVKEQDRKDAWGDGQRTRELLAFASAFFLIATVALVFWVGLKQPSDQLSAGMPLSLSSSFTASTPEPSVTVGPAAPLQPPAITASASVKHIERTLSPQRVNAKRVALDTASQGGVVIKSANLSLLDDGSGHPALIGSVMVANRTPSDVTEIDLKVRIGDRAYALSVLGPSTITRGGSVAIAVRTEIPTTAATAKTRTIVLNATLNNPPWDVMDTFEAG